MKAILDGISKKTVMAFLGYRGQDIDENLSVKIDNCIEETLKICKPRLTYKLDSKENIYFLEGKDVFEHLSGCGKVALLAVTVGAEIEKHITALQVKDMTSALICDACASAAVERVCDNFCKELQKEQGRITSRFSPGYGDWPLKAQPEICRYLVTEKIIGLTVSVNSLLMPRKSVTAVIGIKDGGRKDGESGFSGEKCSKCSIKDDCAYGEIGGEK